MRGSTTRNIHDLPNEVLIEIFSYLDNQSIQNAAKVCQSWHILVASTPKIYRKIDLLVRCFSIDALLRDFSAIPVTTFMLHTHPYGFPEDIEGFHRKLTAFFTRHSSTIEFTEMFFYDMNYLSSHLKLLTHLQHLNLVNSRCFANNIPHADPLAHIEFPHLRTLGLKNATHALRHLRLPRLTTLKVIDTGHRAADVNLDAFLCAHETLREVKFMGFIPRLSKVDNFRFHLTALSVLLKGQPETPSTSILALLTTQRDSLRELKLVGFDTRALVEFALSGEMRALSRLEVDVSKTRARFDALKACASVRHLMVQATARNVDNLVTIVRACVEIESLHVVTDTYLRYDEFLTFASKMTNLRHLRIDSVLLPVPPRGVKFEQLETLTVTRLGNENQIHGFVQLVSRCPRLRKASALGFGVPFYEDEEEAGEGGEDATMSAHDMIFLVITTANTLRELELKGRFALTDEVVEVMLSERCKLKKFTFSGNRNDCMLMERVRRLHAIGIQCCIERVDDEGRKASKRKASD